MTHDLTIPPIVTVGPKSMTITSALRIAPEDRETAWAGARKHVRTSPDRAYIMGRYVHGGLPANRNGHIFDPAELVEAHKLVPHSYLNLLHRPGHIIGTFAASEYVGYEEWKARQALSASTQMPAAVAADFNEAPYVDSLAVIWRYLFPDEYMEIKKYHDQGMAWLSMETVPRQVECAVCQHTSTYQGVDGDTYCDHMKAGLGYYLREPLFLGGGVIIPPAAPGWANADITQVGVTEEHPEEAAAVYEQVAAAAPHLSEKGREALVATLLDNVFPGTERKVTVAGYTVAPKIDETKAEELMSELLEGQPAEDVAAKYWETVGDPAGDQ